MSGIALILLLLSLLSEGCSLQYVDDHGARHIVGLTHTIIKEARAARSDVVAQQVSTIGLSFLRLPEHSGVALGYAKNFSVQVNSADEAGELTFSASNPTDFTFAGMQKIMEGLTDEKKNR